MKDTINTTTWKNVLGTIRNTSVPDVDMTLQKKTDNKGLLLKNGNNPY